MCLRRSFLLIAAGALIIGVPACDFEKQASKNAPKALDRQELVNETNFLASKLREHEAQIQGLRKQIDGVKNQISETVSMPDRRREALKKLLLDRSRQIDLLREEKLNTEAEIERLQEQAAQ